MGNFVDDNPDILAFVTVVGGLGALMLLLKVLEPGVKW